MKGKLYLNYMANVGHSKGLKVAICRNLLNGDEKRVDILKRGLAPTDASRLKYQSGEIDWEQFRHDYLIKLYSRPGLNALMWLLDRLKEGDVTVLCYCKPDKNCHRYILGEVMKDEGIEVIDIVK